MNNFLLIGNNSNNNECVNVDNFSCLQYFVFLKNFIT